MAVVLELLLPCEQRGWIPHIWLPPGTKVFWGMFPFKHQYHPSSHQLKHNIFVFFLCLPLNLLRIFASVVYIDTYCSAYLGYFLWNSHNVFCDTHVVKVVQMNTCSTEYIFHTHWPLCGRQKTSGWVACCSVLKWTQYTVKHNGLMPYNNVLYVSFHQNYHQVHLLQKLKNITTLATCKFFFREIH